MQSETSIHVENWINFEMVYRTDVEELDVNLSRLGVYGMVELTSEVVLLTEMFCIILKM